ncbi:MAG TPA: SRPBCC domain-containing protein [Ignavibacteriaceae bacterium]|nr:SRPBCC domain-containing protein [Ignavibacteriaceae bacterium]
MSAKILFDAWLSSDKHSSFTGGKAQILPRRGTRFTAWDGYISGSNIIIQPYGRIVQTWRTTEFPPGAADSTLEILFEKVDDGTKLTILHTNIPSGESRKYEKGWRDYYFKPMKKYFKKHQLNHVNSHPV